MSVLLQVIIEQQNFKEHQKLSQPACSLCRRNIWMCAVKKNFFFPFLLKFSLRWLYLCPKGSRDRKLDTPCSYKEYLSGDSLWLPIPWWKSCGWLLTYPTCVVLSQSGFEIPYSIPFAIDSFPLGMLLLHILSISLPLVGWAIESQSRNKTWCPYSVMKH